MGKKNNRISDQTHSKKLLQVNETTSNPTAAKPDQLDTAVQAKEFGTFAKRMKNYIMTRTAGVVDRIVTSSGKARGRSTATINNGKQLFEVETNVTVFKPMDNLAFRLIYQSINRLDENGKPINLKDQKNKAVFRTVQGELSKPSYSISHEMILNELNAIAPGRHYDDAISGLCELFKDNFNDAEAKMNPADAVKSYLQRSSEENKQTSYRDIMIALVSNMSDESRVDVLETTSYFKVRAGFWGDEKGIADTLNKIALWNPAKDSESSLFDMLKFFNKKGKVAELTKKIMAEEMPAMVTREKIIDLDNSVIRNAETQGARVYGDPEDMATTLNTLPPDIKERSIEVSQQASANGEIVQSESHAGLASRFAEGGGPIVKATFGIKGKKLITRTNAAQVQREVNRILNDNPNEPIEVVRGKIKTFFADKFKKELVLNPLSFVGVLRTLANDEEYDILGEKVSFLDLMGYDTENLVVGFTYLVDPFNWSVHSDLSSYDLTDPETGTSFDVTGMTPEDNTKKLTNKETGKEVFVKRLPNNKYAIAKQERSERKLTTDQVAHTGHMVLDTLRSTKMDEDAAREGVILFNLNFDDREELNKWLDKMEQKITTRTPLADVQKAIHEEVKSQFTNPDQDKKINNGIKAVCINETQEEYWNRHGAKYLHFTPTEGLTPLLEGGTSKYWLRMGYYIDNPDIKLGQMMVNLQAGVSNFGGSLVFDKGGKVIQYAPEGAETKDARSKAWLSFLPKFYPTPNAGRINSNELFMRIEPDNRSGNKTTVNNMFGGIKGGQQSARYILEGTQLSRRNAEEGRIAKVVDHPNDSLQALKKKTDIPVAERCANIQDGNDMGAGNYAVSEIPADSMKFSGQLKTLNTSEATKLINNGSYNPVVTISEDSRVSSTAEDVEKIAVVVTVNGTEDSDLQSLADYISLANRDKTIDKLMFTVASKADKKKIETFLKARNLVSSGSRQTKASKGTRFTLDKNLFIATLPQAPIRDKNGSIRIDEKLLKDKLLNKLASKAQDNVKDLFQGIILGDNRAIKIANGIQAVQAILTQVPKGPVDGMDETNYLKIKGWGKAKLQGNFEKLLQWFGNLKHNSTVVSEAGDSTALGSQNVIPGTGKLAMRVMVAKSTQMKHLSTYRDNMMKASKVAQQMAGQAEYSAQTATDGTEYFDFVIEGEFDAPIDKMEQAINDRIIQMLQDEKGMTTDEAKIAAKGGEWQWDIHSLLEVSSNYNAYRSYPVQSFEPGYKPFNGDITARDALAGQMNEIFGVLYTGKVFGAFKGFYGSNLVSLTQETDDIDLLKALINEKGVAQIEQAMGNKKGYLMYAPIEGDSRGAMMRVSSSSQHDETYLDMLAGDDTDVIFTQSLEEGYNPDAIKSLKKHEGTQVYTPMVRPIEADEEIADTDYLLVSSQPVIQAFNVNNFIRADVLRTRYSEDEIRAMARFKMVGDTLSGSSAKFILTQLRRPENALLDKNDYSYWGDLGWNQAGNPVKNEGLSRALSPEGLNMEGNDQFIILNGAEATQTNPAVAKTMQNNPADPSKDYDMTVLAATAVLDKTLPSNISYSGGSYQALVKDFADNNDRSINFVNQNGQVTANFESTSFAENQINVTGNAIAFDLATVEVNNGDDGVFKIKPDAKSIVSVSTINFNESDLNADEVVAQLEKQTIGAYELQNGIGSFNIGSIKYVKDKEGKLSVELTISKRAQSSTTRPLNLLTYSSQQKVLDESIKTMTGPVVDLSSLTALTAATDQKQAVNPEILEQAVNALDQIINKSGNNALIADWQAVHRDNSYPNNMQLLTSFIGFKAAQVADADEQAQVYNAILDTLVNYNGELLVDFSLLDDTEQASLINMVSLPIERDASETQTTYLKKMDNFYQAAFKATDRFATKILISQKRVALLRANVPEVTVNLGGGAIDYNPITFEHHFPAFPKKGMALMGRSASNVNKTREAIAQYFGNHVSLGVFSRNLRNIYKASLTKDIRQKVDSNGAFREGDKLYIKLNDASYAQKLASAIILEKLGFNSAHVGKVYDDGYVEIETFTPDDTIPNLELMDFGNLTPTAISAIQTLGASSVKDFLANASDEQLQTVFDAFSARSIIHWRTNAYALGQNPDDFSAFKVSSDPVSGKYRVSLDSIRLWETPKGKTYSPQVYANLNGSSLPVSKKQLKSVANKMKQFMRADVLGKQSGEIMDTFGKYFFMLHQMQATNPAPTTLAEDTPAAGGKIAQGMEKAGVPVIEDF